MSTIKAQEGVAILVEVCARLLHKEAAIIVSDPHTECIGESVAEAAGRVSSRVRHLVVPAFSIHGQEPPDDVAADMRDADVVFGLTRMSMAHTAARLRATAHGTRYLSLPDYSWEALESPALRSDFLGLVDEAAEIADVFTRSRSLRVTTRLGTDLTCDLRGRTGNAAPGVCLKPGDLASPPDAESNIAPVESGSNGVLVIDGSVPCAEIGLLESPLTLWIEQGRVVRVEGAMASAVEMLFARPQVSGTRVVAEIGVGLNPAATLCGSMLEDEGCRNTCHIGIGSNVTIGGINSVPFHLDFVMREAHVQADGVTVVKPAFVIQEQSA